MKARFCVWADFGLPNDYDNANTNTSATIWYGDRLSEARAAQARLACVLRPDGQYLAVETQVLRWVPSQEMRAEGAWWTVGSEEAE